MRPFGIEVAPIAGAGNAKLIVLSGSVSDEGTVRLQEEFAARRDEGVTRFVIDMKDTDFISSAGMGTLVTQTDELETMGGSVYLASVGKKIQGVLDALGLDEFFRIFASREAALVALKNAPAGEIPKRLKTEVPQVAPRKSAEVHFRARGGEATPSSGSPRLSRVPAVRPAAPPPAPQPASQESSGPATSDTWTSPLAQRYAGRAMLELFSDKKRFTTWRALWIALAEAERELGLPIKQEQIEELKAAKDKVDARRAADIERETRHDVMAHIRHYGEQAPGAAGILHLGATSMFVVDNTDLVLMREALDLLIAKVGKVCRSLAAFARKWRDTPAMGFTHFQPAQVTTVGRRACLWLQDFVMDLKELKLRRDGLRFLGAKGAIGTQASFVSLFDGDAGKVERLDELVSAKMGFKSRFNITGQTYTRKLDSQVMSALSGIAQSASKFSNDIRLAQSRFEMQEPFAKGQVGSSAMAYKQNPMKSERIAGIARYVMALELNAPLTAGAQWFERTLDDSANKRLSVPEGFLATDAILNLVVSVADGLIVHPKVVENNLRQELPFLVTEDLLMAAVKAGGDRQKLHEVIRTHSVAAAAAVREQGLANDLISRLKGDPAFGAMRVNWNSLLDAHRYTGRAGEQVDRFLADEVEPALVGIPEPTWADLDVRV